MSNPQHYVTTMFLFIKNWWQARIIKRSAINRRQWGEVIARLPILQRLTTDEKNRLIRLSVLFLHQKSLEATHGLNLNEEMKITIALQACLPILNLGMEWYQGWSSVILYPAQFTPERTYIDENGLEHQSHPVLIGEAWSHGPVILSWEESEYSGFEDGQNVIIHEFAHKLDLLNGSANGFPPLHPEMDTKLWVDIFTAAYADIQFRLESGYPPPIDSYAATSPGEFFAVCSELFFERPDILKQNYLGVYQQLALFYHQETLSQSF